MYVYMYVYVYVVVVGGVAYDMSELEPAIQGSSSEAAAEACHGI